MCGQKHKYLFTRTPTVSYAAGQVRLTPLWVILAGSWQWQGDERRVGPTLGGIGVELIVGLGVLFLVVKLLGPTQVGQVTPFHFIAAILLGELVGNAVYQPETGVGFILFAIALTAGVLVLLEWISLRFSTTRALVQGNPEIVIHT